MTREPATFPSWLLAVAASIACITLCFNLNCTCILSFFYLCCPPFNVLYVWPHQVLTKGQVQVLPFFSTKGVLINSSLAAGSTVMPAGLISSPFRPILPALGVHVMPVCSLDDGCHLILALFRFSSSVVKLISPWKGRLRDSSPLTDRLAWALDREKWPYSREYLLYVGGICTLYPPKTQYMYVLLPYLTLLIPFGLHSLAP